MGTPRCRAKALFGVSLIIMTIESILQLLSGTPQAGQVHQALQRGSRGIQVEGLTVAAKSAFIAALRQDSARPLLIITYNYEQAERLYDDITTLGMGNGDLLLLPPADMMIYQEGDTDLDIVSRRLSALTRLQDGNARIEQAVKQKVMNLTDRFPIYS